MCRRRRRSRRLRRRPSSSLSRSVVRIVVVVIIIVSIAVVIVIVTVVAFINTIILTHNNVRRWRKFIPLNAERPFADNGIDRHNGFELNILSLRLLHPLLHSQGLNRRVKCKHLNGSLWGSHRIYGHVVNLQPFCQQFSERPDTGKFTPPPLLLRRRIIPEIIPGGRKSGQFSPKPSWRPLYQFAYRS